MALLLERGYNATQAGGREDLSDLIANVDSRSTVFCSMARKGKKPGNVKMGWQMDKYEDPQVTGTVDGTDVDMTSAASFTNPAKNRVLMENYAQIFRRVFRVSSLANEIQNVAGVKSELANGIAKKLVEIKRDMEMTFLNDADAQIDNGTNAYLTKSLGSFLHASGTGGGASDITVPANFRCTAIDTTATASLTESAVQTLMKTLYENTGVIRDYDLILGTTLKRAFTDLTQTFTTHVSGASAPNDVTAATASPIKTFSQNAKDKSYINCVNVFEGDFGRLRLHPSTFIAEGGTAVQFKGYALPMDEMEIRYGKLPQIIELQDNGGGPARLIESVAALVVNNPLGCGYFNAAS